MSEMAIKALVLMAGVMIASVPFVVMTRYAVVDFGWREAGSMWLFALGLAFSIILGVLLISWAVTL